MIPSPETTILHFIGLKQAGMAYFTQCEKCGEWKRCAVYEWHYKEGIGHRQRLCEGCAEAFK